MAVTIEIKRGDTSAKFQDNLTINGVPVNLGGGCIARFILRRHGKPQKVVSALAIIIDPNAGGVEYQPVVDDIDEEGVYDMEWEITFPSGQILTFPNNDFNTIEILRDLGGA